MRKKRLVVRRGAKRKDDVPFKDLGSNYHTKFNNESKDKYYMKKLQELCMSVPVSLAI